MKILLVEDDKQVAKLITATLTTQNYTVDVAGDGVEGWEWIRASSYDLVLLDVMLPKLDGISLCRQLRAAKQQVPIILLTARDTSSDKMAGLDAGADDYIVKPIDLPELTARIRALLRRSNSDASPILEWGNLRLNPATLQVSYGDQPLNLRRKEFAILELLLHNRQRVFSRSAILDKLWSFDETPSEEVIKAHIKAIRRQLKTVGAEDLIETLYGQGYRLNPQYLTVVTQSTPTINLVKAEAARSRVAQIWQQTKHASFNRLAVLEQAVQAMKSGELEANWRRNATQSAHKLAGSLGTFGFPEGSQIAKQLEMLLSSELALQPGDMAQMARLVEALRQQLEVRENSLSLETKPSEIAIASATSEQMPADRPLLLIVDRDRSLTDQLAQAASHWQLGTVVAADLITARKQIRQSRPDILLLDLALADEDGLMLLEELAAYRSQIPVLVLSQRDRVRDRVEVARLGGRAFLPKPASVTEVMQTVSRVLQEVHKPEATILAVDDDPQILLVLKTLIEPWGLQLITLEHSAEFWQTLQTHPPHLVMLDVEMPEIDGIELCQAIRNDPRWSWLPVLFLTSHRDAETMYRVFEVGADDYISKPIVAAELINRILNRLERTRLLRSQAEVDPLTGVANRQRGVHDLEKLLERARNHQQAVCLAVVEVDHLKETALQYNHDIAERMLRQVGQLLKQKLPYEAVVARWGSGPEFVVGLYGTSCSEGEEWLTEILASLRQQEIISAGDRIALSFSAGVAQYPTDGMDLQKLYWVADAVLQQAKATGDRILTVSSQQIG